jgi:YidC/Oxa1 family membrane protein insertase
MQSHQQEPGDQKNLLLAILLSIGVLMAWNFFYASPKAQLEKERQERLQQEQQAQIGQVPGAPGATAQPDGPVPNVGGGTTATPQIGSGPIAVPGVTRRTALEMTKRVAIETPSLSGSINLTGGRIDDLALLNYHETIDRTSPNIILFSPANAPNPYFAESGWVPAPGTNVVVPSRESVWTVEGGATKLTPQSPITLRWNNGQGLVFKRVIAVDPNYMFEITDTVENKTASNVILYPYSRIYRYGTPKLEGFWVQHEGMIGYIADEKLKEFSYSEAIKPGSALEFKGKTGGWLGFTDKYWAAALIPDQSKRYYANMLGRPAEGARKEYFQTDYRLDEVVVAPSATQTVKSRLFAGAKQVQLINQYEQQGLALEFSYMIDWGWFYFITRPLHDLIHWFYMLLGNFGLAILAVTVVVKVAFFWFANKSYESMAKMKKLQPEMEKLRERYKDDKVSMQKELMDLYRKEKVNPMAGCLPVLIQIPVFFALYKVLFISIDMRHAPFYGWIKDLSDKDPTSLFNLFGLLPYTVPDFLVIGIWPVLMGITMWLQMQLNPQQPDPIQQQVFNWMPVMFTFLLAAFPAGLVIYWAWNNVLSLAQQYFIMKRQGVDVPLLENVKRNFGAIGRLFGSLTGKSKS